MPYNWINTGFAVGTKFHEIYFKFIVFKCLFQARKDIIHMTLKNNNTSITKKKHG
jgi:hypothetical protein